MCTIPMFGQPHFVSLPSFPYESGYLPSVAISGTSVVEVHQGTTNAFGPLWYRSAVIDANGTVLCSPKAIQYDMGGRPSVAISGTNVIEVHQGTANAFGPLWYRTGQIQLDGSVAWNDSHQYDNGGKPSVAISGHDVIEVHQGTANAYGPLWFKTGRILSNGDMAWSASGSQYDNGGAPRVAISGPNIIEVHQGTANASGALWYKTAQLQEGSRVTWSATANYYDTGGSPAVSLAGATVFEVHAASVNALGALWFRAGQIEADGSVTWNPVGSLYDRSGNAPSVALAGAVALEANQSGAGVETYHPFRY
jgi:hypothetical protein